MKTTNTGILTLTALLMLCLAAQSNQVRAQSASDEITLALQAGNAVMLSPFLNPSLDLSLPDNEGTYSKKQAEQILKMFFSKNPAKSFTLEHSGNSNNGSTYLIGSYKSIAGKVFQVYLLIKERNGNELIQQLQFEEE